MLFDDNGISIDGPLSLADSVDQIKRFEAAGWNAWRIDGHDQAAIAAALEQAQSSDRPVLIACKTTIGYGAPNKAGNSGLARLALGRRRDQGRARKARLALSAVRNPRRYPVPPGARPARVRKRRMSTGASASPRSTPAKRAEFERRMQGDLPQQALAAAVATVKEQLAATPKDIATRSASEFALEAMVPVVPEMVGGSADLTGSNNTRTKSMQAMSAGRLCRPLHPLRRARARHGGGHERHGAARRHHPL